MLLYSQRKLSKEILETFRDNVIIMAITVLQRVNEIYAYCIIESW
jgi:hypothetical protein